MSTAAGRQLHGLRSVWVWGETRAGDCAGTGQPPTPAAPAWVQGCIRGPQKDPGTTAW